jgi:hypothetical protein
MKWIDGMAKHWAVITGFQPSLFGSYINKVLLSERFQPVSSILKKTGKGAGTTYWNEA